MIHFTQKLLYAWDIREIGLRQQAQSRDEIASSESLAGRAFHHPNVLRLVVSRVLEFRVELHMLPQVIPVDDVVQIRQYFGLFDVVLFPMILDQVVLVPAVAIDCRAVAWWSVHPLSTWDLMGVSKDSSYGMIPYQTSRPDTCSNTTCLLHPRPRQ